MAFKFAGDRGQHLMAALEAADQQKAKFRDTGLVLFNEGVAKQSASQEFENVGAAGSFARDLEEYGDAIYGKADRLFRFNQDFG